MTFKHTYLLWIIPSSVWLLLVLVFGFDGLYGQDAYEYARYTGALKSFFLEGNDAGSFFWPVNYPLIGSFMAFLLPVKYALMLLSLLALIGSLHLMKRILFLLYPEHEKTILWYLIMTACISPYFMRSGMLAMSDQVAAFFCLWAFYSALKYGTSGKFKSLIFASLALGLAVGTRYPAAIVLFPIGLWLFINTVRSGNFKHMILALGLPFAGILTTHWLAGFNEHGLLEHGLMQDWSLSHLFSREFQTFDGTMKHDVINLFYGLSTWVHPAYFGLGILLIPFIRRSQFASVPLKFMLISVLIYQVFLMGIPFQNMRFHILIYPFVTILFFQAYLRLKEKVNPMLFPLGLSIFAVLQLGLFTYSFGKIYAQNELERSVAAYIEAEHDQQLIYGFGMDIALQQRLPDIQFISLWDAPIASYDRGSWVIFNELAFEKQWEGKNPMINWHSLENNFQLTVVKRFDNGWVLYEIN